MKRLSIAAAITLALSACGGGSSDSKSAPTGNPTGTGGGGTSTAQLLPGNGSACAPNLCVNFGYPTVSAARVLTGSVSVKDTSTLTGYAPRYSLVSGALPPGMSLDPITGTIAGTPTTLGNYSATIGLTVAGFSGSLSTLAAIQVVEPKLSFNQGFTPIVPGAVDTTKSASFYLPGTALSGQALSLHGLDMSNETLATNGGLDGRVVYSVVGSVPMPPGLSLDAATGAITGTPTQAGVWITQVKAVVTTAGATDTFTGYAAIAVGTVVQETRGAAAAAPVHMAVHVDPSVSLTSTQSLSGGGGSTTTFTYDAASQQLTLTPGAVPTIATPGTYLGSTRYVFTTPDSSFALEGYVEAIQ